MQSRNRNKLASHTLLCALLAGAGFMAAMQPAHAQVTIGGEDVLVKDGVFLGIPVPDENNGGVLNAPGGITTTTLQTSGNTSVGGTLAVTGSTTTHGMSNVSGGISNLAGGLTNAGGITNTGGINNTGGITNVGGLTSAGNSTLNGDLTVNGNTALNGTLDVTQMTTTKGITNTGNITNTGLLTNNGNAKVVGDLEVTGTVGSAKVNAGEVNTDKVNAGVVNTDKVNAGEVNTDKVNAGVVNAATGNFGTVNATTGNITNDLTVGHNAIVKNNLIVDNDAEVKRHLTVGQDINVGRNAVVNKDLIVKGNSDLQGHLTVGQDVNVGRNLSVTGMTNTNGIDNNGQRIQNVGAAVAGTDAVNLNQLNERFAETNKYVDNGVAAALAIPSMPALAPGKGWAGMAVGNYGSATAVGLAVGYQVNERWNLGLGVSQATRSGGKTAVKAQAGFSW